METSARAVQTTTIDHIVDDLTRLLAILDENGLQIPAIHIAKAIEILELDAE